jgi:hypothetical protein
MKSLHSRDDSTNETTDEVPGIIVYPVKRDMRQTSGSRTRWPALSVLRYANRVRRRQLSCTREECLVDATVCKLCFPFCWPTPSPLLHWVCPLLNGTA